MDILNKKQSKRGGFTITELMIAIAVIGILASIVMVAYPGYQKTTRDNERKSDLTQLASAMSAYVLKNNNYMGEASGCGLGGDGSGWISLDNAHPDGSSYASKSILKCLKDAGVVSSETDFIDPLGCLFASGGICGGLAQPGQAYMKATCIKPGSSDQSITYFMAHLENEPRKDAELNALCKAGSLKPASADQNWGSTYGMNYYVTVK